MNMRMGMDQVQTVKHVQILAPRMIQSMEILQLPIMALQERIQQELQENPVLEIKEAAEDSSGAGEDAEARSAEDAGRDPGGGELVIKDPGSNEVDFDRLDALSRD